MDFACFNSFKMYSHNWLLKKKILMSEFHLAKLVPSSNCKIFFERRNFTVKNP